MLPSDEEVKSLQNHEKPGFRFQLGFSDWVSSTVLVLLGAQMKTSLVW